MKNFIQNKLRLILEGVYATKNELAKFRHKMVDYKNRYTDDYFKDITTGEGVYKVSFDRQGRSFSPGRRGAAHVSKSRVGASGGDDAENQITFIIRAGRGVEHKDTYKTTDIRAKSRGGGMAGDKPGSPFNDAVIKAVIAHGEDILDHMGELKYTDGDSGAKIAAAANSPELTAKVQAKKDKYDSAASKPKNLAPDVKALEKEAGELMKKLQSLTGNDKSVRIEAKKVRDELKFLNKKIKELSYAGSSKDDYLKSKNK